MIPAIQEIPNPNFLSGTVSDRVLERIQEKAKMLSKSDWEVLVEMAEDNIEYEDYSPRTMEYL